MFKITAEYVKTELQKIAFLLESNYNLIYSKNKQFLKQINSLKEYVKWDEENTYISDYSFSDMQSFSRAKRRDEEFQKMLLETNKGNKLLKYTGIKGEVKETGDKVFLRIERTPSRNYWFLDVEEQGKLVNKLSKKSYDDIKRYLSKMSDEMSEAAELDTVCVEVFRKEKKLFIKFMQENLPKIGEEEVKWQADAKCAERRLKFKCVPKVEKADLEKAVEEADIKDKLEDLIYERIESAEIDPDHIMLKFTLPGAGPAIQLAHNPKEKHEDEKK